MLLFLLLTGFFRLLNLKIRMTFMINDTAKTVASPPKGMSKGRFAVFSNVLAISETSKT